MIHNNPFRSFKALKYSTYLAQESPSSEVIYNRDKRRQAAKQYQEYCSVVQYWFGAEGDDKKRMGCLERGPCTELLSSAIKPVNYAMLLTVATASNSGCKDC